ncbi:MAG: type IV secretion protein Rhs, partial [Chloroflexi bacterium]
DDASLDIGKTVVITVEIDEQSTGAGGTIFTGEITSLEPNFSAEGWTFMTVRCLDKSHRLHRGRKTRTFLKVTDSDLVSTIAGEAGLSVESDATSVIYEHVIQYNQTNMEFLKSRAERIGYQIYVEDGKLCFKKGDATPTDVGTDLVFMENLYSFEPRWTASPQADKMIVKSWDVKQKTAISSEKTPVAALNQGGMTTTGGAKATSSFNSAEEIIVSKPVFTTAEATELATGLSNDISREFVQAEGVCDGLPKLLAGKQVNITNIGTRFSGKYRVTSALHSYTIKGYKTHFTISGRHPNTLSQLVQSENGSGLSSGQVEGVVPALVTNLTDPDNIGRVKVKYAWLGEIESDWVRVATPMAGASRGIMILPEINDEVLIAFEHGDIHRPYIVGGLWSSTDSPPLQNSAASAQGKVNQRIFKTRQGHTILLDDKQGEEKISIKSKSGHEIIFDDKTGSEMITLKDKTGSNKLVIKSSDNSMAINVGGDFSVTATGKITLKGNSDVSLETAGGNATIKGMNATLKASANATVEGTAKSEVKGAQVSVNGTGTAEVKSAGMTTIQGGLVKIN